MIIANSQTKFNQSEFLSSVCHEFKTPVSAIISMTDLLKDIVKEVKQDKLTAENDINFCINQITKTAEDLLELTQDFLDVNDNKESIFSVNLSKKIDISQALERSIRVNYDYSLKKNINISYHIEPNLKPINLDEKRLKQILSNLISNSLKYSPESTEIYVTAKKVIGRDDDLGKEFLEISVQDQGFGMNEDQINIAFGKFGIVENENHGKVDSFGMGLAIVKKLVELQNGQIEVESEPNEGSIFTVRFGY